MSLSALLNDSQSNSLPTLETLVQSMKGSSATNLWDVVVSYSVDKLNQLLTAQYTAGKLIQTIPISTTGEDRHGSYPLTFNVKLGSPTIQFISGESGKCKLVMPITGGTYKVDADPDKVIPVNVYQLIALVPLAAMTGDTKTVAMSGTIITFTEGAAANQHITLHFSNTVETSYEIVTIDGKQHDEDDYLKLYLMPKLQTWFKDNVSEIDYSLTAINNSAPSGDIILKPKSFVFASAGESLNGVLSLYIQTEGSGNPTGNPNPSFQPDGKQMLPVPDSHTASIILSHDLVTKSYFQAQFVSAGYTTKVVTVTEGIALEVFLTQSVVKCLSERGIFSSLSVGDINLNLKDAPLNFIVKDSAISMNWKLSRSVDWSESHLSFGHGGGSYGTADITVLLNTQPVALTNLTDKDFSVNVSVKSSDYQINVSGESPSFWERLNGKVKTPPYELEHLSLDMPAFDLNLGGLNFFSTANLMFPGKQTIDVDKTTGIKTPYDFLITGHIHQNASSVLHSNHVLASLLATVYSASVVGKTAAQLMNELLTSQPVLSQLVQAMATEKLANVDNVLQQNGYGGLTADDLQKTLNNLHSSEPDIRLWGGAYSVSAPAWLKGKQLIVSNQTGRVTLDNTQLAITIVAADHITWQNGGKSFDVYFHDTYDSSGKPLPFTLTGSVTTPDQDPSKPSTVEGFVGQQYVAPPGTQDWTDDPATKTTLAILSILGIGVVGVVGFLFKKCRGAQVAPEMADMRQVVDRIQNDVELVALRNADPTALDWPSYTNQVRTSIRDQVLQELHNRGGGYIDQPTDQILADIRAAVTNRAVNELRRNARMTLEPKLRDVLGQFADVLNFDNLIGEVTNQVTQAKVDALSENVQGTIFIDSCINNSVYARKSQTLAERIGQQQIQIGQMDQTIQQSTQVRDQNQIALNEVNLHLQNPDLTEEQRRDLEANRDHLQADILAQEHEIQERQAERLQEDQRRIQDDVAKTDADQRRDEADHAARERGETIFGE